MARIKPVIYMDACCFIDAVKEVVGILPSDRTDDVWHIKKLLEAHRLGDISVVTSTLSLAECVAVEAGQAVVPEKVQEQFRKLLTSGQYLSLAQQTPKTGRLVQELRWQHHLVLRGADVLHVATALERGAKEFISTDDRLKKSRMVEASTKLTPSGIRFIRASETHFVPDRLRQGEILNA
jgi:predicted nucleic acid-binding protein